MTSINNQNFLLVPTIFSINWHQYQRANFARVVLRLHCQKCQTYPYSYYHSRRLIAWQHQWWKWMQQGEWASMRPCNALLLRSCNGAVIVIVQQRCTVYFVTTHPHTPTHQLNRPIHICSLQHLWHVGLLVLFDGLPLDGGGDYRSSCCTYLGHTRGESLDRLQLSSVFTSVSLYIGGMVVW